MEDGIFEGLKVLDCASFIAAPAAATVLSDFGAEVIKIEPPGIGRSLSQPAEFAGISASARIISRGCWNPATRRSLALDLSKPEGQAVLYRLVGRGRRLHHQFSAGGARAARDHL